MRENFLEEPVNEKDKKQEDRVPVEYRNPFHVAVFKILIAEKILDKNDMDEAGRYSKIISDFIDNSENIQIRELILQRKFNEAAEMMVVEIQKEEGLL